jgi:deoxyribonuclease IV
MNNISLMGYPYEAQRNMGNRVGIHLRMQSSLQEVITRADYLDLPFFQCFFVPQETGKLVHISEKEIAEFLVIRRECYGKLYCHASYWVNLSSLKSNGFLQLRREIVLAKQLEFTHVVLHPGTAKGAVNKSEGIDALAFALNMLFKYEKNINILLENGCHAKLTIGNDILDFKLLLEKIDRPERINFCIDTAHAYSYGYNIATSQGQEQFINLLQTTIGINRIKLIHLNDTYEQLGSFRDRHAVLGEGLIGIDALKNFVLHSQLKHIPLLMELPEIPKEEELKILNTVRGW